MADTKKHVNGEFAWTLAGQPWMALWPTIESELRKVVWRRLPSECDVDDVLQEVCTRMLSSGKELADLGEAVRYATTIACNYVRDLHRRRNRSLPTDCFEHTSQDVERAVLARLRFRALEEGVAALSADDRQAFADPKGDASLKSGAVRVRRSRVRARIAASIKGAVGGGFAFPRLRWFLVPASAAALFVPTFPTLPQAEPHAATAAPAIGGTHHSGPFLQGRSNPVGRLPSAPSVVPATSAAAGREPVYRRGQYKPEYAVDGPMGTGAETGRWDPPEGDGAQPLVCISGVSPTGDVCTPADAHPRNAKPPT